MMKRKFGRRVALALAMALPGVSVADLPEAKAWIDVTSQLPTVETVSGEAAFTTPLLGYFVDREDSAAFNLKTCRPGFRLICY